MPMFLAILTSIRRCTICNVILFEEKRETPVVVQIAVNRHILDITPPAVCLMSPYFAIRTHEAYYRGR